MSVMLIDKPWAKAVRCLPNELARYALFTVGTSQERRYYTKPILLGLIDGSHTPMELQFVGPELRQDDLDVYLELLHYARNSDLSGALKFKRADLMKSLGWARTPFYYKRLLECMRRLSQSNIEGLITRREEGDLIQHRFNFNLVDSFEYKDVNGNMARYWNYRLPVELVKFFTSSGFARIDIKSRQALRNNHIAKWLQFYFSSHKANNKYAVSVEKVMYSCGSKASDLKTFRQKLKAALKLLKATGIVDAYIDKESDRILRK
ncbi:Trans replication factor TrfA1 [Vibrio nigripulchritudo SOn1]|uniref:Trans replication factor TrfA1 n=1 Tax=Vibrio nigripulchritudo SOn1 TaxID=1238450 RepID=A0AAV2VQG1_9VIBR|nr:plasmid replication initiator TrfA [Vibrio nigripulchritudo]CCO46678.1 Trans replication factor TrfA1 [Vibrio nigripulchritudo SOn1]